MLVLAHHAERAHVQSHRSNLGPEEELLHFRHVPRGRSLRMLVYKVSVFSELLGVDLEAKPYVILACLELLSHHLWVSPVPANLL